MGNLQKQPIEKQFTNINEAVWEERADERGGTWRALHLGGEHLGVRVELIKPGEGSSIHHFHTMEEEHVIILDGTATLFLGADEIAVKAGDHFWQRSRAPH